jgi:prepilin-type N-terminal cleavage/methylation domain-containing protein
MVRRRRLRSAGFTIIEMMIVLCIVGVMAAAIAPSLGELLADNRQSSAAMDLVRLARQTRAQASTSGLAQLIRFRGGNDDAGANGLGAITVYAGMNTKCMRTPWQLTLTPASGTGLGPSRLFHMGDYNPSTGTPTANDLDRHVIALSARLDGGQPQVDLRVCYQPNGEVYVGVPGLAVQTASVLFSITRTMDRAARGRERQVILPVGGNARVR